MFKLPDIMAQASKLGQLGCQIFFVLSGFGLSLSWYKGQKNVKQFYKRRWWSIAPGYYAMILLYSVLRLIGLVSESNSVLGILVNALFLNGLVPAYNNNIVRGGWYIGTTALFYLIFPWLIKKLEWLHQIRKLWVIPICTTILSCLIGASSSALSANNSFFYFSILCQFAPMCLGIMLYFQIRDGKYLSRTVSLISCVSVYVLSAIVFFSELQIAFMIIPLLVGVGTYCLVMLIREYRGCIVINQLGKASYGIFLVHMIFAREGISVVKKIMQYFGCCNEVLVFIISLCFTLIGSYFAGKILMNLLVTLKKRIQKNL